MAAILAMPKRTIEREIKKLRDGGRITREGSKKKGWWKIN
jgi:predicted HTH transcriptional regulator